MCKPGTVLDTGVKDRRKRLKISTPIIDTYVKYSVYYTVTWLHGKNNF